MKKEELRRYKAFYLMTIRGLYGLPYKPSDKNRAKTWVSKVLKGTGEAYSDGDVALVTAYSALTFPYMNSFEIKGSLELFDKANVTPQAVSFLYYVSDFIAHGDDLSELAPGFKEFVESSLRTVSENLSIADIDIPSRYVSDNVISLCEAFFRMNCQDEPEPYREVTQEDAERAVREANLDEPVSVYRALAGLLWMRWPSMDAEELLTGMDSDVLIFLSKGLTGIRNILMKMRDDAIEDGIIPDDAPVPLEDAVQARFIDDLNKGIRQDLYASWGIADQLEHRGYQKV